MQGADEQMLLHTANKYISEITHLEKHAGLNYCDTEIFVSINSYTIISFYRFYRIKKDVTYQDNLPVCPVGSLYVIQILPGTFISW